MDNSVILDILLEKIKKDYLTDVSLVYVHGSYLRNDFHSLSDIDLFIVTKTNKGKKLGLTFILNEIGYDFWTVSWEWLEKVANYDDRTPSLITEGKIVFFSSKDDLTRFKNLQEKAITIDKEKYKTKALEKIKDIYKIAFLINISSNISEIRNEIIGFIYMISEVLSLINCKNIKRQRKHFKSEIMRMENIPSNFERSFDTLFSSNDIQEIKEEINYLTNETRKIIDQKTKNSDSKSFKEVFNGWYEEMIQHYNKIYYACNTDDNQNALFATVELDYSLNSNFDRIGILPDLPKMVDAYDPNDLKKLKIVVQEHQKKFEELLAQNDIEILKFDNVEKFKEYYSKM